MSHDALLTKLFSDAYARQMAGDLAGATLAYKRIQRQFPDFPDAWVNGCLLLIGAQRFEDALVAAERAVELDGGTEASLAVLAESHYWMGHMEDTSMHFEVAHNGYLEVLGRNPRHTLAMLRMSEICCAAGLYDRALNLACTAARLEPENSFAHFHRGSVELHMANYAGAEASFRRALALEPNYADAHQSLTFILLITGRYLAGWRHLRASGRGFWGAKWHDFGKPRWKGEPLNGRTLLVYGHREVSGYGDNIQFARFLPRIKERHDCRIVVYANEVQRRLFAGLPGMDLFVVKEKEGDGPLPHFDVTAPWWGLAMLTDTDLPDLPPPANLTPSAPPPPLPELGRPGFKVGLVWAASIGRRLEPGLFDGLAGAPGLERVAWYGLQLPPAENPPKLPGFMDMSHRMGDFFDAAQLVRQLDLVVTVDTAMAHLAGSLGAQTVVLMLHPLPDWRWGLGDTADWYPTARPLRQPLNEGPESVVRMLGAEIARRAQEWRQ